MEQQRWTPAYVGIGSNLGEPVRQVERAFAALAALPESRLVARSRLYRSRPMGPVEQPDFVNAAAGLLTRLDAPALLAHLKRLEAELGRSQPVVRWGPRVIDFDVLLFGDAVSEDPALTLPHAGLLQRNWVLYPLADIAPDLVVPRQGRVADLAARLGPSDLSPLA